MQDLQGRPLGKASVHLPSSVVHSWLLAVEGSQHHPGAGLLEVAAGTGHSEEEAQEAHPACELAEAYERHQGHSERWGAVVEPEVLAAK